MLLPNLSALRHNCIPQTREVDDCGDCIPGLIPVALVNKSVQSFKSSIMKKELRLHHALKAKGKPYYQTLI